MVKRTNDSKFPETSENGMAKPRSVLERLSDGIEEISVRQSRLEALLCEIRDVVGSSGPKKEYYTTAEVAVILGRAVYTVRQWARLRRINAEKTHAGRGIDAEWRISHSEIQRYLNEGLLPIPGRY